MPSAAETTKHLRAEQLPPQREEKGEGERETRLQQLKTTTHRRGRKRRGKLRRSSVPFVRRLRSKSTREKEGPFKVNFFLLLSPSLLFSGGKLVTAATRVVSLSRSASF